MTEDTVSEVKLKLDVYVIKLDIEKELSHRSIFGNFLLVIGSLSVATMSTKTGRKSSEN